jgi:hypothetical protein
MVNIINIICRSGWSVNIVLKNNGFLALVSGVLPFVCYTKDNAFWCLGYIIFSRFFLKKGGAWYNDVGEIKVVAFRTI